MRSAYTLMCLALLACGGATTGKDGAGVSGSSTGQNAGEQNGGGETVGDHFSGAGGQAGTGLTEIGGAGPAGGVDSNLHDGGGTAQPRDATAVTVIGPCPNGTAPTRVVQDGVDGLTVTSTHVYWLGQNLVVMRQSKATGMVERLADMANRGTRITTDATRIYWEERDNNNYSNVYSMPMDLSAQPVRVGAGLAGWALGADRVYLWKGMELDSAPKTGGVSALVLPNVLAQNLAADATGIYWFDWRRADAGPGGIQKFTFALGMAGDFAQATFVFDLTAGGGRVVWIGENDLKTLWWSSPAGDGVRSIQTGITMTHLNLDATNAYFFAGNFPGTVDLVSVPFEGGNARKIACALETPQSFALDDTDVYIGTFGGIFKASKGQ